MEDIAEGHTIFSGSEQLIPMQTFEPMQSPTIAKLIEALAKAQGEIQQAHKDKSNPFFKSNYADLASNWDACRAPLSKNGLAVIQTTPGREERIVTIITMLAHSSGEFIKSRLSLKLLKDDPQGVGSTLTYARRYALAAMVGIAPADDDGEVAMGRLQSPNKPQKPAIKPQDRGHRKISPQKPSSQPEASNKTQADMDKADIDKEFSTTTDLHKKIRKFAERVKELNSVYGDSWLANQCGKFGGAAIEEIADSKSLNELLAVIENKGKELKAAQTIREQ